MSPQIVESLREISEGSEGKDFSKCSHFRGS